MKKLLLTTTALAGMTGVAVADVSLSGGAHINYKTASGGVDATFTQDANLTATMSSSGAYSASVGVAVGDGEAGDGDGSNDDKDAASPQNIVIRYF